MRTQSIKSRITCIRGVTRLKTMLDWSIVQVASMYQSIDQWEETGTFCIEPSESHTAIPIAWQAALLVKSCACFFVRAIPSYCDPFMSTRAAKKRWVSWRPLHNSTWLSSNLVPIFLECHAVMCHLHVRCDVQIGGGHSLMTTRKLIAPPSGRFVG